jgi:hypothetical protein
VQGDHPVQLVRDRAYLEWRFARQPDHTYHLLRAGRHGVLSGYLIWRTLLRRGLRIAHLVDFVAAGDAAPLLDAMVGRLLDLLRAERIEAVLVVTSVPRFRRLFFRRGFLPWLGGSVSYFHVRAPMDDPERALLCDPARWHLTMGDGDLEPFD